MKKYLLSFLLTFFAISCSFESADHPERIANFKSALVTYDSLSGRIGLSDFEIDELNNLLAEPNNILIPKDSLHHVLLMKRSEKTDIVLAREQLAIISTYPKMKEDIKEFGSLSEQITIKNYTIGKLAFLLMDARQQGNIALVEQITAEMVELQKTRDNLVDRRSMKKAFMLGRADLNY